MATTVLLGFFDVLSHHHHPGDVVFRIPASGDIEDISKLVGLGDKFQLVVKRLDALQGIVHGVLHLLLELGHTEDGNQLIGQDFLLQRPCYFPGLIVVLIDVPIDVDPKDLIVGRVDQLPEIIGDGRHSPVVIGDLCNILEHPHHPDDVVL